MSDDYDKLSLSHQWLDLAVSYREFDILVSDINEVELDSIGQTYDVANLSPAIFSSSPLPVNGHIRSLNSRFMIPLTCQCTKDANKPIVNIWFMVVTGSPFTCLTVKSMKALLGSEEEINENSFFEVAIQDQSSNIQCRVSKTNFKEVNLLGTDALRELQLSLNCNWKNNKFQLYKP